MTLNDNTVLKYQDRRILNDRKYAFELG